MQKQVMQLQFILKGVWNQHDPSMCSRQSNFLDIQTKADVLIFSGKVIYLYIWYQY